MSGAEEPAGLADGADRHRAAVAARHQVGALERVDGDLALHAAGAQHLPHVELGRLVLLPLADDHGAGDRHLAEFPAHGVDGGLVGLVALAPPQPARGGDRRLLGDLEEVDRRDGALGGALVGRGHGGPVRPSPRGPGGSRSPR
jgi:hypothetical protein